MPPPSAAAPAAATESFGAGLDRRIGADDLEALDQLPAHVAELVRAAWALGGRPELAGLRLRAWAHMLGFRGHWSTKSRRYSTTFTVLRRARVAFARRRRAKEGVPLDAWGRPEDDDQAVIVVVSWAYVGTGYAAEGERWLALSAAARAREQRRVAWEELRITAARAGDAGMTDKLLTVEEAADRHVRISEADLLRGAWTDPRLARITFGEWVERWWPTTADPRPGTRTLYRYLLRRFLLPAFEGTTLGGIDAMAARSWLAGLHEAGEVMPTTIAKAYRLLRRILNVAVEAGYLPRNPVAIKGAGLERAAEMRHVSIPQLHALAESAWKVCASMTCGTRPRPWRPLLGRRPGS